MRSDDVKALISYRLEQSGETLEEAQALINANCPPRGIINRSYYAMFYAVLALLQTIGQIPSRHAGTIGLFDKEFVKTGLFPKDLSKHIHRAFELRQKSDYQVDKTVSIEKAIEAYQNAVKFVDAVKVYLSANENI